MNRINFKNRTISIIFGIVILFVQSSSCLNSQCCMMMKGHGSHSSHNIQNNGSGDTTLIRKGIIDVESIDVNKDGYVYQDQMDWNVISDKPGQCPICGMELQKLEIKDAKKNLKKHNFEVKE